MNDGIVEGIKFFNLRRYEVALQHFEAALPVTDAEKTDVLYYRGLCYTKLEKYDEALLFLEQVVTGGSEPLRTVQCRLMLAYIYIITNKRKMAEFELDQLRKTGTESVLIYTMLGFTSWSNGNKNSAIEYYEKALSIEPANLTAQNSLGFILVDSGVDVKRGLELCRKAVSSKPSSAAYLDSLGWAYFKSGDTNEARNMLRRALELSPRQNEIARHMRAVIEE